MKALIAALLFSAACTGTAEVRYSAPLPATTSMVQIDNGVYAVADQDDPVFFADNYYWRFHDNHWYRTNDSNGNWLRVRPPEAVLRIREPHRYQHYRPTNRDTVVIRDQRGRIHRR